MTPGLPLSNSQIHALDEESIHALSRAIDLEIIRRHPWPNHMARDKSSFLDYARWRGDQSNLLLARVKSEALRLHALLDNVSGVWSYCDPIYRFYHRSFKVYSLQESTLTIRNALQSLMPDLPMNALLTRVIEAGTGHTFTFQHNEEWIAHTLPITTAFFHSRYFLEMAVRCSRYEFVESPLGSDLAALLYLFDLR